MCTMQLTAEVGQSGQMLFICSSVVLHMLKHQQVRRAAEAGGQLFGRITDGSICVEEATGPRVNEVRSRYSYRPNRSQEQAEIDDFFRRDLMFLGDWHTHPESKPKPSGTDLGSMQDCFARSRHNLSAFLLLIVGTGSLPSGLYGSLHNRSEVLELKFKADSVCAAHLVQCTTD